MSHVARDDSTALQQKLSPILERLFGTTFKRDLDPKRNEQQPEPVNLLLLLIKLYRRDGNAWDKLAPYCCFEDTIKRSQECMRELGKVVTWRSTVSWVRRGERDYKMRK